MSTLPSLLEVTHRQFSENTALCLKIFKDESYDRLIIYNEKGETIGLLDKEIFAKD